LFLKHYYIFLSKYNQIKKKIPCLELLCPSNDITLTQLLEKVYPGFIGRYPSGGGDVSDVPNNYKLLKVI